MRWLMASSVVTAIVLAAAAATPAEAAPPPGYTVVSSSSMSASIDSQSHGVVACPAATVPLGGGVNARSTSYHADIAETYPVGTEGWTAYVNNNSGAAFSFTVWAVCGTQPAGYTQVESPRAIIVPSDGGVGLVTAACPLGTKVLSGGGSTDIASTSLAIESSYPSKELVGTHTQFSWNVVFENTSAADALATAWAICGSPAGYRLIQRTAVSLASHTAQTTVHPTCPSPKVPLGGGVQATMDVGITLNRTFPSGTAWRSVENNNSADLGATMTPYVICAGA